VFLQENNNSIGKIFQLMTNVESSILQFLEDNGLNLFTTDIFNRLSLYSKSQLYTAINDLAGKGAIIKLEKGKYCTYGFSDAYAIGCFLANNSCISYWTAMNLHRLTEQIPNVIFVQTDKQKTSKLVYGVEYRFVRLQRDKIFGYKTQGYGNHSYLLSDVEKTIIDCFDIPQYSGGYPEIIKAFYKAKLNAERMIKYCKLLNNLSVIKRLAFLADLFEKENLKKFIDFAQKIKNKKYNLFETNGETKGKTDKKYGLILNITKEEIFNMAIQ
jgi:predicted transcriptional regulator of viral defense system